MLHHMLVPGLPTPSELVWPWRCFMARTSYMYCTCLHVLKKKPVQLSLIRSWRSCASWPSRRTASKESPLSCFNWGSPWWVSGAVELLHIELLTGPKLGLQCLWKSWAGALVQPCHGSSYTNNTVNFDLRHFHLKPWLDLVNFWKDSFKLLFILGTLRKLKAGATMWWKSKNCMHSRLYSQHAYSWAHIQPKTRIRETRGVALCLDFCQGFIFTVNFRDDHVQFLHHPRQSSPAKEFEDLWVTSNRFMPRWSKTLFAGCIFVCKITDFIQDGGQGGFVLESIFQIHANLCFCLS